MKKSNQIYNNNSKINFENFLLKMKLEELLKFALIESDSEKIKTIKKIINLKVNYFNENNQRLYGIALLRHKNKILKKYANSKYEQFIHVKKFNFKKIILPLFFILLCILTYNQREKLESYYYHNIKNYEHNNSTMKYNELNKILIIKTRLGDLYLEKDNLLKAYEIYSESYSIYNQLNKPKELKGIEDKYRYIRKKLYVFLENRVIELQNNLDINSNNLKKEIEDIYNVTKNSDLYKTQGKILELKGDLLFKSQQKLNNVKSYYVNALKLYKKDKNYNLDEINLKIKSIDNLLLIKRLLNEARILQLKNKTSEANLKYNEINKIYDNLDFKYQIFNFDENIERKK